MPAIFPAKKVLKNLSQGIQDNDANELYKVYPNPATTVLNIQYVGEGELEATTFVLYDMTGKLIMRKSISVGLSIIDLPILAKGMYTYTISSKESIAQRDKLLIE